MYKDLLIEPDYMNYDYLEAKSVPGQILDWPLDRLVTGRPVMTSRPAGNRYSGTGTGHQKSRPVPSLTIGQ